MKKLYCKVPFHQFKKGEPLPQMSEITHRQLLKSGMATTTKPKPKAKKDVESN